MTGTPSYGEALAESRRALVDARLADPDEHYPYKTADAKSALKRKDMGPDSATKKDVTGADFLSERIVEASAAYIEAQADWIANPESLGARSAYDAARDDLVAARRTHRRARVDAAGNPAGAVVAMSTGPAPDHQVGPRARRVGED